jgi:cytidyltransferase-like protein
MGKAARDYFFHREKPDDVEWLRPKDFERLTLRAPVVLINGCFDLLHVSHMRMIFAARKKAGTLICALDEDAKIKKEKGPLRPIMTFAERASALNYMPVDYICPIRNSNDMNQLIATIKPDLRVQGSDYKNRPSRYKIQKMLVREGGIHTTAIVERILKLYDKSSDLETV